MASKNVPRKVNKPKSPWVRLLKQGLVLFATVIFLAASVLGFLFINARRDAEEAMNDLQRRIDSVNKPVTKMLDRNGEVIFSVSAENRIPLKIDQIPKFVQNAVIAAEDRRFYQHRGVDVPSLARVFWVDIRGRKLSQGGSTITMQLVKLLFNGSSKTFRRKMNDIAYAQVMEQRLPKERILELYLNKVFFGEGSFGIGEAAKVYFDKDIKDLTIGEAAMLARCIRRPSVENPIRDLEAATDNRDVVLGIMRDEGMITEGQYDKAKAEKPHINPKPPSAGVYVAPGAEYFVDHVKQFLSQDKDLELDLLNGGYTIETTLDFDLQKRARKAVEEVVRSWHKVNQGCFMAMDRDGNILCEVGGLNYRVHQQNLITQGSLQPGSGFKPILYATALRAGKINMNSMLSNAPIREVDETTGKVWEPSNSSPRENHPYYGLRTAVASSINLCAIHTIQEVGPQAVVDTAYEAFGFRSKLEPYEPLALGSSSVSPMEMAEAYSVFMLRGNRVRPQPVARIVDADGTLVKQYQPQVFQDVFDANVCDEVDELMRGVVEYGTGTEARVVPNARGKTGTSNRGKDLWFTGYADGVLGTGWTGHEVKDKKGRWTPTETNDISFGGTVTAKIWAKVMLVACKRYGKEVSVEPAKHDKPKPPEVKPDADVDPDLGTDAGGDKAAAGDTMANTGDNADVAAGDTTDQQTVDAADSSHPKPDKDKKRDKEQATVKPAKVDDSKSSRTKRPPKNTDDTDEETVSVEICEQTGLLANMYCPDTVTRTFKKGKEPKRRCRIHGPDG